MLINLDEKEIIKGIIKSFIPVADIDINDIEDNVRVDVENWLAEYGLYSKIVNEVIKEFNEMNIEVLY